MIECGLSFYYLSSSGIRIGALPSLKLTNLEDNKIVVYENTNDEYFTFITPECKSAIDSYLDMRKRYGEKLDEDSYLIREQFDIRDPFAIQKPKQITHRAIEWRLISLAERCGIRIREHGIRIREHETENRKYSSIRKDVPIAHGFRKFFTTQLVEADVKTELRWLLEGHNLKANDPNYVRTTEKRLQQEYEKAIDNLTIDPANRLQRKVETLTIEKSRVDKLEEKIRRIQKMYR